MARRMLLMGSDQHVEHAQEPRERRQHGHEQHHRGERRHVLPHQLLRPGKEVGDMTDSGGLDAHQGGRAHDRQQHQRRQGQRDDVVEAMGGGAAQCRRAACALRGRAGGECRDHLKEPAARAFAQLRQGRRRED